MPSVFRFRQAGVQFHGSGDPTVDDATHPGGNRVIKRVYFNSGFTGQISYDRDDRYARRLGPKDRMSFSHPILTLPDDLVDRWSGGSAYV